MDFLWSIAGIAISSTVICEDIIRSVSNGTLLRALESDHYGRVEAA